MRIPRALSFTSLKQWRDSREQFYTERLSDRRVPSPRVQGQPAAVGSAFDVIVKMELSYELAGYTMESDELDGLFEKQIDAAYRGMAKEAGRVAFDAYKASGAYDDLLRLLEKSFEPPRFEFDVQGAVGGVPFFGRPDCGFEINGIPTVLDWKVRGYFSSASPTKGFMLCRDGWTGKQSRSNKTHHPAFRPSEYFGIPCALDNLDATHHDYAMQLSIYSWVLGAEPGNEDFICQIEELLGAPPNIRVATHRARIGRNFQLNLLREAQECWLAITSGHIFADLSRDESDARCALLDRQTIMRPASRQLASIAETYGLAV